ncbi:MAG: DegV family protein [Dehalococcoidales bacterium]|jgi:DegV family protein with EDD domain|nr:DegV family protein [Dehalococcoidales bacterium]MDD3265506.1 DegV family protein [Dehalococcoidales bacterium]MDD4323033.1 DegV family protein [Dehalococcoidales bacterium]MDD4794006.1 DegV family protein [Dehalococcoidales bacterium]MDD5499208.1 DegV family protein [Dehalococcoidales bacterium]
MAVAIVTDTVSCLEQERVDEFDISLIPVYLTINGKEYRDRFDLSPDDFWKLYPDLQDYNTSAPPMAEFLQVFERLSKKTSDIACAFVSKSLSATAEAALQARQIFQKDNPGVNIEIIDSRTAAGAQAFIVLEMARAARAGKNLSEVVATANEMIPKVKYITALEGLKRLIKIGRAPKTAYIGELFQVKPIIGHVNNTGIVENLGRGRGTEKTMLKIAEMMESYVKRGRPVNLTFHYTNSIEEGEKLKDLITSRFNVAECNLTPYSPVICLAIGPATSVAFYQSDDAD